MELLTLMGIAVSLAMDAFSVSIAAGTKIKRVSFRHYFRLAFHFGLFQFLMPLVGYYSGVALQNAIKKIDHWVAFGLLAAVGIKMIWESFKVEEVECQRKDPSRGKLLIILAIATSIDAAAIGFSFAALGVQIIFPAVIIGLVCVVFSAFGVFLGDKIGSIVGVWAERVGGCILIGIGIKILLEHIT